MSDEAAAGTRSWGSGRAGGAVYTGLMCAVVLALAGLVGLVLHQPWLFPSLGPTAMLLFSSPGHPSARPLNTIVGHAVGIAAGFGAFVLFGLVGHEPAPVEGLSAGYVGAAVVAIAVTAAVLHAIDLPHPPAGATTLIVALGILSTPLDLVDILAAVVLITLVGWAVNRALRRHAG